VIGIECTCPKCTCPKVFIGFPMEDLDICEKTFFEEYSLQFSLSIENAEFIRREIGKSITKAKKNINNKTIKVI
jgi:hypothetical protein